MAMARLALVFALINYLTTKLSFFKLLRFRRAGSDEDMDSGRRHGWHWAAPDLFTPELGRRVTQ